MRNLCEKFIYLFFIAALLGCESGSTDHEEWLTDTAQPIPTAYLAQRMPPNWIPDEISFLTNRAGRWNLLLLGEEQHGIREFSRLKARLVAAAVSYGGVRAVFLEQGVADVLALDRWIGGTGDPGDLPAGGLYWCWAVESFGDLLHWLRNYNDGRADSGRVHLYGIDVQSPGPAWRVVDEWIAANGVRVEQDARIALETFAENPFAYAARGVGVHDETRNSIADVVERLELDHSEASAESRAQEVLRAAKSLLRSERFFRLGEQSAQLSLRDELMAEEVTEIASRSGFPGAVIWSHNAHVKAATDPSDRFNSMGSYLKDGFPKTLLIVGLFLGRGSYLQDPRYRVSGEPLGILEPSEYSWNRILSEFFSETVILDIGELPAEIDQMMKVERPTSWGPTTLSGAFDGILFVPTVHGANPLD